MYAQAFVSAKQRHGKGRADQQDMPHSIGKNWAIDLPDVVRNGTFLIQSETVIVQRSDVLPEHGAINGLLGAAP